MGSHKIWDLGLNGPNMDIWDQDGRIWGSGMNGALWDLGFGVGWPLRWRYGVRDEWDAIRSGIWGRVDQRWSYGTRMRMGMGMDGFLWDVGFGVGWTNPKVDIWGQG